MPTTSSKEREGFFAAGVEKIVDVEETAAPGRDAAGDDGRGGKLLGLAAPAPTEAVTLAAGAILGSIGGGGGAGAIGGGCDGAVGTIVAGTPGIAGFFCSGGGVCGGAAGLGATIEGGRSAVRAASGSGMILISTSAGVTDSVTAVPQTQQYCAAGVKGSPHFLHDASGDGAGRVFSRED